MNIYPNIYLSIYKALTTAVPYSMFNERVKSILAAMAEFNLIHIIDGKVKRNEFNSLPNDFLVQLNGELN